MSHWFSRGAHSTKDTYSHSSHAPPSMVAFHYAWGWNPVAPQVLQGVPGVQGAADCSREPTPSEYVSLGHCSQTLPPADNSLLFWDINLPRPFALLAVDWDISGLLQTWWSPTMASTRLPVFLETLVHLLLPIMGTRQCSWLLTRALPNTTFTFPPDKIWLKYVLFLIYLVYSVHYNPPFGIIHIETRKELGHHDI